MQRRIALAHRPQHNSDGGRYRTRNRPLPMASDPLRLSDYRLASRWQSLLRFWLSILSVAAVGGVVLEYLGPPSERSAGVQPLVDLPQAAKPPQPVALPAKPERPAAAPAAVSPTRSLPDQPLPPRPNPAPDAPAPSSVAQQDTKPPSRVVMVLHPARSEGSAAIASRLAAQTGLAPDQVEVGATGEVRSEATIRFYSADDHALARRLGKELARMNYTWRIENFSTRPWAWKDQAIEVWLPDR